MYKMVLTMSLQLCWVPEKVYQSGKWMILSVQEHAVFKCNYKMEIGDIRFNVGETDMLHDTHL